MENVTWGAVPTQRKKKEEQFLTPVLTMVAIEGKGTGRRFIFNKAAQELLGLEGEGSVMFGFSDNSNDTFLINSEAEGSNKLTKTCTFSDKKKFEAIIKRFLLDDSVENHLDIIEFNENVFQLQPHFGTEMSFESMDLGTIEETATMEADLSSIPTPEVVEEDIPQMNAPEEEVEIEELHQSNGKGAIFSAAGSDFDDEEVEENEEDSVWSN